MTRFFVRHPVTTWMLFTAFVVLGIYSLPKLQIEAMPEVALPSLTVSTGWNGASPKAIQKAITIPVEEAVRKVKGVENVISTSRMGQSVVEVEFTRDTELDFARLEVNEQLGTVRRNLPLNATQPQIVAFVPEEVQTEEFFVFSLESEISANDLREKAESWILPQVLAIDGVADAQVRGGARSLLKIVLDRTKLELYQISADEVLAAVDQMDDLSAAGPIRQDGLEKLVALRDPVNVRRLENSMVARRGGREYTLGMLGEVRADFEDPTFLVRSNGRNVVDVVVERRSGANTVTVSRNIKKELPTICARVPFEVRYDVEVDQGADLQAKLKDLVIRSLLILVVLFVLLAVSLKQVRLTAIVIGSILFSIVICLSLFYFFGISVNFITISGLTICFGLLLDNSILVLDSIHRRLDALDRASDAGLSRKAKLEIATRNIVAGTNEVLFPVMATTLTTMVAFLSFIFLSGRLALFYVPLAISVAMAMGASLFVAFGWIPMVLNQTWVRSVVNKTPDGSKELSNETQIEEYVEDVPDLESRPSWFERVVGWNQLLWWAIVPALGFLFFYSYQVYEDKVVKEAWWGQANQEELLLFMRMPAGTEIETTSEILRKFEDSLMPVPEGAKVRARCFGSVAILEVEFEDELLRSTVPLRYRSELVAVADQTAGASVFIRGFADTPYIRGNFGGSSGNSLIKITGYNSHRLDELARRSLRIIERQRRVRNARVSTSTQFRASLPEETVIRLDREALAIHKLSVTQVVADVRRLVGVDIPWSMLIEGEQERVQISFDDAEDMDFGALSNTLIRTPDGDTVRLGDLVTLNTEDIPGEIERENQRYSTYLNWEYVGTDRMRKAYIKKVLSSMDLPYGYEAEESEQAFFTDEEEEELALTLWLAVAFVFMVLAALFESFSLPILVATSIPMGLVGVVLTYWKSNTAFDSSARIGLVLLFGIVVNNAILLASRFRHECGLVIKAKLGGDPEAEAALFPGQRKELGGTDMYILPAEGRAALLRRAVGRAVRIRLRSILLTSGTTILGLVPLLLSETRIRGWLGVFGRDFSRNATQWLVDLFPLLADNDEGQEIWENLALSSIGGLISSTILILIAIPALYYMGVRMNWWGKRFMGFLSSIVRRRREAHEELPLSSVTGAPDSGSGLS